MKRTTRKAIFHSVCVGFAFFAIATLVYVGCAMRTSLWNPQKRKKCVPYNNIIMISLILELLEMALRYYSNTLSDCRERRSASPTFHLI